MPMYLVVEHFAEDNNYFCCTYYKGEADALVNELLKNRSHSNIYVEEVDTLYEYLDKKRQKKDEEIKEKELQLQDLRNDIINKIKQIENLKKKLDGLL